MSRIGKAPVVIPSGVEVKISPSNLVSVKGPKGELTQQIDARITLKMEDGKIIFSRSSDVKEDRAMHGLYRALVYNMIEGVTNGYSVEQELVGVGYRVQANGQKLEFSLGYSHNIVMELAKEIKVSTTAERGKNPTLKMESHDKQLLGAVAAKIRSFRKPEPYKGKGIKFVGEQLRRKAGKSASKK